MRRQITSTSLVVKFSAAAASRWLPSGCWVDTYKRQLTIFTRHGVGDLAFQVKLLLLAAGGLAFDGVRVRF